MARGSSKWMYYAGGALLLAGLIYLVMNRGNIFGGGGAKSTGKPASRGRVQSAPGGAGVSEGALRKAIQRGDKFAVGIMSDQCGHCNTFKPAFFAAKAKTPGLKYFNATNSRDEALFKKLGVRGFPSIVYVDGGRAVGEYRGNRSAGDVANKVGEFLKS